MTVEHPTPEEQNEHVTPGPDGAAALPDADERATVAPQSVVPSPVPGSGLPVPDASPPGSDASPPGAERSDSGEATPRVARRRLWDRLSGPAGALSAVVGVVALVVAVFAWLYPRAADSSAGRLEVVSAEITRLQDIAGDTDDRGTGDPRAGHDIQDAAVDVILRNRGGSPVLVEEVTARVLDRHDLEWCPPSGPYLGAGARYDLVGPQSGAPEPDPVPVRKPLQVPPNSFDRLAVTIGPDRSSWPVVYTVELTAGLADADGDLPLGTFTIASPASSLGILRAQAWSGDPVQEACVRDNERRLREILRQGSILAPDVVLLQERLGAAVQRLDRGEPLLAPPDAAGPAAVPLSRCSATGLPTVLDSENLAELSGDDRPDTVLVQACAAPGSPRTITMVDGASGVGQVLLDESDGVDRRGLAAAGTEVLDGRLTVYADAYRAADPDAAPALLVTEQFAWDGRRMQATQARTCTTRDDAAPVTCTP
jgi:hypothetical protein